jgi:hypothetical protein
MAKLYNLVILGPDGQIGNQPEGRAAQLERIMMATGPRFDDHRKDMEMEKTHPAALREASTYANFASTREVYINKARRAEATPYYIALADWFTGPKVLEINVDDWTGKIGQTIRVKARDNVKVAGVSVVIRDGRDHVLETGEAVQSAAGSPWWIYTTRSPVRMTPFPIVEAIAYDLPGHRDYFVIS